MEGRLGFEGDRFQKRRKLEWLHYGSGGTGIYAVKAAEIQLCFT